MLLLGEALGALEAGEPADATLRVDGDPEFAAADRRPCTPPGRASAACASRAPSEPAANRRYRWSASVTGFAALRVLRPEAGLHVFETPDGRGGYTRRRVRVTVTPGETPTDTIVRRYRERPSRSFVTPCAVGGRAGWTSSSRAGSTSSSSGRA